MRYSGPCKPRASASPPQTGSGATVGMPTSPWSKSSVPLRSGAGQGLEPAPAMERRWGNLALSLRSPCRSGTDARRPGTGNQLSWQAGNCTALP